jgi:hypothetical protein
VVKKNCGHTVQSLESWRGFAIRDPSSKHHFLHPWPRLQICAGLRKTSRRNSNSVNPPLGGWGVINMENNASIIFFLLTNPAITPMEHCNPLIFFVQEKGKG